MVSALLERWERSGSHWEPARPISEIEAWAHRNGIPVLGTIGDFSHLNADPAEDHTPYSETAWPLPLPGYIVCAIDLAEVRNLGAAILRGARAGKYPWLKYINVGQRHYHCRDGFQASVYNSDTHNHLSIRTDYIDASIGDFDPLGDDMNFNDRAILSAMANLSPTMVLDTGGAQDGSGPKQAFPVAFSAAIIALKAATAAEATRDAATMATLTKLLELGGADAAPIVAAIRAEGESMRVLVAQQHTAEMAELRRQSDAELAGLRAEVERLTAAIPA